MFFSHKVFKIRSIKVKVWGTKKKLNMNSLILPRFLNRTSKFNSNTTLRQSVRVLQKFVCIKMSTNVSISQTKEKKTFQETLPCVIDSVLAIPKFSELPEVANWVKKVLEYNMAGGKQNRGMTTVIAYEMLEKPDNITEESLKLARIMGWCVEMAYFLVADDMMDRSTSRRGVPCWYRLPDVGFGAINDLILINTSIFQILKTHFAELPQYTKIVDLFNEISLYTSMGQHLDYTMANRKKNDYSLFTISRYEAIVKHKTAYYTYKLPICLGLLLANITDKDTHERVEVIAVEIGKLFQMQDDFIDCFSYESVTGKAGTDIQEGKCSWLAVTALQRCNTAQRLTFEEFYGSQDPTHVERIKQLYTQLELPRVYAETERALYDAVVLRAQALSRDTALSPKLFLRLIDMIYHRRK